MTETTPTYISRNARPGWVQCPDPKCSPGFGHPHYHKASKSQAIPAALRTQTTLRDRQRPGCPKQYGQPSNPKVEAFLDEVEALCLRHGMSLAHQDHQGAFVIEDFDTANIKWLRDAIDRRSDWESQQ